MSAKYTEQFLESVQRRLPELATPRDLVRCGLYRSAQAAYSARRTGRCPPYLRIPQRGIVYPKPGVIAFLRQFIHEPDRPAQTQTNKTPLFSNASISNRNIARID